jgi:hypothetical protein
LIHYFYYFYTHRLHPCPGALTTIQQQQQLVTMVTPLFPKVIGFVHGKTNPYAVLSTSFPGVAEARLSGLSRSSRDREHQHVMADGSGGSMTMSLFQEVHAGKNFQKKVRSARCAVDHRYHCLFCRFLLPNSFTARRHVEQAVPRSTDASSQCYCPIPLRYLYHPRQVGVANEHHGPHGSAWFACRSCLPDNGNEDRRRR